MAASIEKAVELAGAFTGGGLALGGGAIGAAIGDSLAGSQTIAGIARQPEVQGRLYTTMFLIVGLVEGMYFINLAFMALFVFVLAKGIGIRVFLASNFLVPNATFVVELIAFLLVLGILAKYVLPPVNKAMTERQQTLKQALVDAETAKRRAEEAEADYKKSMEEARAEARAMVEEANKQSEQLRFQKAEQATQEYERRIARAEGDINALARRAAEDVRRDVANLVIGVVEKVVGEGFGDADHQALIERAISEVEAEAASAPEVSA